MYKNIVNGPGVLNLYYISAFSRYFRVTEMITTSLTGTSPKGPTLPVFTPLILSTTLIKNCAVVLWGAPVRAMARVPLSFGIPIFASLGMGSWVFFCRSPGTRKYFITCSYLTTV